MIFAITGQVKERNCKSRFRSKSKYFIPHFCGIRFQCAKGKVYLNLPPYQHKFPLYDKDILKMQ